MPVLETITAVATLANTLAEIRLVKLRALPPAELQAQAIGATPNPEDKEIENLNALVARIHEAADKLGKVFDDLGGKIHDAVTS